jgi:hypothetical protein
MVETAFVPDCAPPGTQGLLFALPTAGPPRYDVIDRTGRTQVTTGSLGVAVTTARHLVTVDAVAWIASTDGTTARLDRAGIASSTPDRPWIRTVASTMQRKEDTR